MLPRFIVLAVACILGQATATCYFPDGDISPADVACDAEASDSFCCYSKQACLSNKICLTGTADGVNQYARGTCTDPSWQSGACPDFCLDQQALGNVMYSCNVTGVDSYCCNDGCSCDASAGEEVVSFTGTPYTISVIGVTGTYPNPSSTTSSSISTTSSSSSTTPTPSTSSLTVSTTDSAYTSSSTPSTSTSSSSRNNSSSKSVAIGAGVGVGVGVGILLLGAGAIFFYRRRRAKRNMPSSTEKQPGHAPSLGQNADYSAKGTHSVPHYASELGTEGHEYSELPANRTHAEMPARRAGVPELPGN